MEVHRLESGATIIAFPPQENRVALSVLKALYQVTRLTFIREAIEDLDRELTPKLRLVSHFHYCNKCQCEIDDRVGDNFIHIQTPKDDVWVHRNCIPLKENRP